MFNIPSVVLGLLALLIGIEAARRMLLTPEQDFDVLLMFSFIPGRYSAGDGLGLPGGLWADLWTPLTYGLLHGDWMHLIVNGVWLAAFGSALAWRFGTMRFLLFSIGATLAGAAAHYAAHAGDIIPMVGASGAISGHMAATARFMFQNGGPLRSAARDPRVFQGPALTLPGLVRDPRASAFLLIWLAMNLFFGLGGLTLGEDGAGIAWEAHIGGFLFGLLAFSWFDPPHPDRAA